MKLQERQIEGFLADPPAATRAALVYGPDRGLVRERADRISQAIVEDLADPFRVAELSGQTLESDPARLGDEMAALALTGGRRVVRVRQAGNRHSGLFRDLLADSPAGDSLIVVEAEALGPRDSLRTVFEGAVNAVAIACYADSPDSLERLIVTTLHRAGLEPDHDALAYLVQSLGSDRLITRSELEKLVLYKGSNAGAVTLADAEACVGDNAAQALDDVAYGCADGDLAALERYLTRAFLGGDASVAVLRRVASHFQRLHLASTHRDRGEGVDKSVQRMRPPVHFSRKAAFTRQLRIWRSATLGAALERLLEAEIDCKSSGSPDETVCRHAILAVAGWAARQRAT